MATLVEMPKLGNTVEECLLTAWRKTKGDPVQEGEVLADIETDKTTFELTAPAGGILLETFFEAGALIPVFTAVCVIGAVGESVEEFRAATGGSQPDDRALSGSARAPDARGAAAAAPPTGEAAARVNPPLATPSSVAASGPLSPRARRFSREHEFHPGAVAGSGPGGRVVEADLRALLQTSRRAPGAAPEAGSRSPVDNAGVGGDARQPSGGPPSGARLSLVRRTIARRLRESLGSTAQYTLHGSANAGPLLALRRRLKASPDTAQISIGDLVVFSTIQALLEVPDLNAELIDDTVYRHAEVHMAFACDTPRGLVVPVIRDSQNLSLGDLSRRIKELAAQAVEGVIAPDDLSGGTFTVTNLGSFGVEAFTPVINPPQVAVLGVDAIQVKPVRKPDGNIEFIDAIGLSLTVDHQWVDGAPGARFLSALRDKIERVDVLCTI
jgi:pyruvate dehydrogenase E2 component (dihydrolipoamide acetyltransferase)